MNPYNNYPYQPYAPQPQAMPIQHLPQQIEPKIVTYTVESAEQLSTINPMPNTIYLGLNHRDGKIFLRRMNNDGLMETKIYVLTGEQTKKTDTQEILGRLENIEKKLNIGGNNESTNVA